MFVHRLRRWPNIKPTLTQCLVLAGACTTKPAAQQTRGVKPVLMLMLGQRLRWWASIAPALGQCLVFAGSVDK